jgi:hypothetical protein
VRLRPSRTPGERGETARRRNLKLITPVSGVRSAVVWFVALFAGGGVAVIVLTPMSAMMSGDFGGGVCAAGFFPVRGGEAGSIAGFHAGKSGEHVGEVVADIDPLDAAVLYDGVEDGAFPAGFSVADEEPVFAAKLGGTDGVFDEVMPRPDLCRVAA